MKIKHIENIQFIERTLICRTSITKDKISRTVRSRETEN